MKIFTVNTKFEDLAPFIYWESEIETFSSSEITKERINDLETNLNVLLFEEEKITTINLQLEQINGYIEKFLAPSEQRAGNYEFADFVNYQRSLVASIYNHYCRGINPTLTELSELIQKTTTSFLLCIKLNNKMISELSERHVSYANIKYGLPLEDAANEIIYRNILDTAATNAIGSFEYKQYLEKRLLVIGNKSNGTPNKQKLNWTGSKKQLYFVLRQLKERDLIGNTYDELVDFLHSNVVGFENDNKGTTAREIKRGIKLPKPKRINLDTDVEE